MMIHLKVPMVMSIKKQSGFTIVELLVVIVVIGILASITIVTYSGIRERAQRANLQTDVAKVEDAVKLFKLDHRSAPESVTDCPTPADKNICVTPNKGNSLSYQTIAASTVVSTPKYELTVLNDNQFVYSSPVEKTSTNEFMKYTDMAPIIDRYGLVKYQIDFDIKSADTSSQHLVQVYMQNGSGAKYGFAIDVTATTSYTHQTITVKPSIANASLTQSLLAFYGRYNTGNIPTVKNVHIQLAS